MRRPGRPLFAGLSGPLPLGWVPPTPGVWGVRVDFRPLQVDSDEDLLYELLDPPKELVTALSGAREIRGVADVRGWKLFRDSELVGVISRPSLVPIARVLAPPHREGAEPLATIFRAPPPPGANLA